MQFEFQIGQDGLGLDNDDLLKRFDSGIVNAYYDYMVDVAVIFGANRTQAELEMKESLEFEMQMANVS